MGKKLTFTELVLSIWGLWPTCHIPDDRKAVFGTDQDGKRTSPSWPEWAFCLSGPIGVTGGCTTPVRVMDRHIDSVFRANEACQRIACIEGVSPKTATAFVAAVGAPKEFKNGRHFAAWLGLVPRQHSSGDRLQLMGISKRGDNYLRTVQVHGARAVLRTAPTKNDHKHQWALQLAARRGAAKAIVAIGNKMARVIWVLQAKKEDNRPAN